jgi:uncharacterized protein YjbI with pentapeptide repeats
MEIEQFRKLTLVFLTGSFLIASTSGYAQEQITWSGSYSDGTVITLKELSEIVEEHNVWINSNKKKGRRASLENADLTGVDLSGVMLREANFAFAVLQNANFEGADLRNAVFRGANLKSAFLRDSNLKGATLNSANLSHAVLDYASLSEAHLILADLSYSWLKNTDLSQAIAWLANFEKAVFEPKNVDGLLIMGSKNLSKLSYTYPQAVVKLRKIAKEQGLRSEERALTSSLRKHRQLELPIYEAVFEEILFRLPSDYGAKPWRSLWLILWIVFIFVIPYSFALVSSGKDGIWKVWMSNRIRRDLGEEDPVRLRLNGLSVFTTALLFSVVSSFRIGWKELNVGDWISRIQSKEYTLQASGWVRTLSGIQSLISIFLLVTWVLTYFGRPFE